MARYFSSDASRCFWASMRGVMSRTLSTMASTWGTSSWFDASASNHRHAPEAVWDRYTAVPRRAPPSSD